MSAVAGARLAEAAKVELLDVDLVPGAPPHAGVVYLHGWGFDKRQLGPLAAAVGPGFGASIFPSLRGHGASPSPDWGYSPWDLTADIQRIADCLPARLSFVGFSFGGALAATAAVALGPARVRSLVVIDCSFTISPESVRSGDALEGSYLKYQFDYTHILRAAIGLGIQATVIIGEASHIVPAEERSGLGSAVGPGLRVEFLPGEHLALVEHPGPTAAVVRAALA